MEKKLLKALFGFALIGMYHLSSPESTSAEVNFHVGIGLPPPIVVVPSPPDVVLIPGTPVYYTPDAGIDIFFYSNRWYRKHRGQWYRASYYNGPWKYVHHRRIPVALVKLPPDYRNIPPGHQRIPYGQLKKSCKKSERKHRIKFDND